MRCSRAHWGLEVQGSPWLSSSHPGFPPPPPTETDDLKQRVTETGRGTKARVLAHTHPATACRRGSLDPPLSPWAFWGSKNLGVKRR